MSFKIGIIGSEGFIGRALIKKLCSKNENNVYCFGKELNSKFNHPNYQKIDLNDIQKNKSIFHSFDLIYYLASASIPSSSFNNPLMDVNSNLVPFLNFLEAIKFTNVNKIVFSSSGGTIYGPSIGLVNEESPKNPESPHGIIKLSMEYFLNYNYNKTGLNYSIFRISNIYGEDQDISKGLGLVNTILEKGVLKQKIEIFGDGSFKRNYIYIKDVANALSLIVGQDLQKSEIYNLASSVSYSINEILALVKEIIKEPLDIKYIRSRKSDLKSVLIDNSKFSNAFPEFMFTKISDGIINTYNHIKNNS